MERTPGHVLDIAATVVELAGAKFPEEFGGKPTVPLQGVSFAPVFAAGGTIAPRGQPIFFEHEGNRAARDGNWKLVAKGVKGAWELYDLEADRSEMHDLAQQHPQRVTEMADAWQRWAEVSNVLPLRPWDDKPAGAAGAD
jgi:arylsulfatase